MRTMQHIRAVVLVVGMMLAAMLAVTPDQTKPVAKEDGTKFFKHPDGTVTTQVIEDGGSLVTEVTGKHVVHTKVAEKGDGIAFDGTISDVVGQVSVTKTSKANPFADRLGKTDLQLTAGAGCGNGAAPLIVEDIHVVKWDKDGYDEKKGEWWGLMYGCKDAVSGRTAYALEKVRLAAKGFKYHVTPVHAEDPGVRKWTVDNLNIKSFHRRPISVLDIDRWTAKETGPCIPISVSMSGKGASIGLTYDLCDGTYSRINEHAKNISFCSNYEPVCYKDMSMIGYGANWKHRLMTNTGEFTTGNTAWLRMAKYSNAAPYKKYKDNVVRYHIEFNDQGPTIDSQVG